jgi:mevalonate kinase
MKRITYRAPAKVILSGEHAVVYGKPALISGLALYSEVSVEEYDTMSVPHTACTHVDTIVKNYLKKKKQKYTERPFKVMFSMHIPLGRGLGSSASLSVALAAALYEFYTGAEPKKDVVNSIAYQAEKEFHGKPSGADNTACCYGGLIFFRKEFEFLKTISVLNFKLPDTFEQRLFLIDTGKPAEGTLEMVRTVGNLYKESPEHTDEILTKIEKVTKRMVVAIVKEDASFFRSSIEENQHLLEQLGVVSPTASTLLKQLKPYGVGKITGAGGTSAGSGFTLFYADNPEELEAQLKEKELSYYQLVQDYKGLQRVE